MRVGPLVYFYEGDNMQTAIKRKASAAVAAILAFVFAFSLLGIPSFASAEPEGDSSDIRISGVDFLQPTAQGWELLRVDNLGDQAIYITIEKDGKPLSNPMKFTAAENSDTSGDHTGTGEKIAQIVAVQMKTDANTATGQSAQELFGDVDAHATYTISVSDAMMQGDQLYSATIYPVYGNIVDEDGSSELVLLGIRTASDAEKGVAKNFGVGDSYYKQDTTSEAHPTSYSLKTQSGLDSKFESALGENGLPAYVVTYEQNPTNSIEGKVNYVDAETGKTVMTETFTGIGEADKMVSIKKSFTATDPDDANKTKYYRAISSLAGTQVPLNLANASYTVRVVPVNGMDETSYNAIIEYVDENGTLLWSDQVDVKGYGYRYTLPNTFSMNKNSQIESADGVNFYRLDKVYGGKVVNASDDEGSITTQSDTDSATANVSNASDANGTAVNLTKDLIPADFASVDSDGNRIVRAVYQSQDATKAVDFTIVEVDGETGEEIGRVTKTITPDADFSYTPDRKTIDGKIYVPWAGNTDQIAYTWESLGQSVDLLRYVYYVPEDYVPGDGYDITVQYMNIANGQVLRTQTIAVDPENTDYIHVVGDERFTQDGNEYVRLSGQESGIRHAFFSPDRTYTIYYRDTDDTINANTVITRTQIITTTVPGTGGGLTAVMTPVDDAAAGDPDVDTGVGAGDGTVVINDDDNPLANLNGQDTSTERTIEDNENPLASGSNGIDPFVIGGVVAGLLAIGVLTYVLIRRRKNARDEQSA